MAHALNGSGLAKVTMNASAAQVLQFSGVAVQPEWLVITWEAGATATAELAIGGNLVDGAAIESAGGVRLDAIPGTAGQQWVYVGRAEVAIQGSSAEAVTLQAIL
jgi:uncharacterized membrane protein